MKVLELFAGKGIFARTARNLGHQVFATEILAGPEIDLSIDFRLLQPENIPFIPDIIWASPPCTTYSRAANTFHRKGIKPITKLAYLHDSLLCYLVYFLSHYPNARIFIENPVGLLRSMPFMHNFERTTITYCSYGEQSLKPTDIFTNDLYSVFNLDGWLPRLKCWNGNKNCHHDKTPRTHNINKNNPKTGHGINGASSAMIRSLLPIELCTEILCYKT